MLISTKLKEILTENGPYPTPLNPNISPAKADPGLAPAMLSIEPDVSLVDECMKNVHQSCMNVRNVPECKSVLPETKLESIKTRSEDPPSVSNMEDRPRFKVKYRENNTSRGKFNLALANEGPVSPSNSENIRKSSSVQAGLEYFRKLEKIIVNLPNSNQTANKTPGKRKIVTDMKGARTPACISTWIKSRSVRDNSEESPAMKQRGGDTGSN